MKKENKIIITDVHYKTENPAYPEAHTKKFSSKVVCDATYGQQWTHTYIVQKTIKEGS